MRVFLEWSDFKTVVTSKASVRYVDRDTFYSISYGDFDTSIMKDGSAATAQTDFETNYLALANTAMPPTTASGHPLIESADPDGEFDSIATHDFTDKTTWFTNSTRVTGETLSSSGLVYSSAHPLWIDLSHGKVTREDDFSAGYLPVIKVAGSVVTSGFTINYAAGTVTFASAPGGTVTADYSWASDSTWTLTPPSNQTLVIKKAEIQFTKDVVMVPILFQIWAYDATGVVAPPGKVKVAEVKYKNLKDILNISNLCYSIDIGWASPVCIFPFDYVIPIKLVGAYGMELRLVIEGDQAFSGEFGTATFYGKYS